MMPVSVHRLSIVSRFIGLVVVIATGTVSAHAQDSGSDPVGFRFLTVGGGARAVALGETMVADGQNDPFVLEYNPAGLAVLKRSTVSFAHNKFFQDSRGEYITAGVPIGAWAIGGRIGYFGVDDIPLRTGPSSQPIAFFNQSAGVFQAGIARQIDAVFSVGISGAYVLEHIDNRTAQSGVIGLGARYERWPGFVIGASLMNMGPKTQFIDNEFRMPNQFLLGVSWKRNTYNLRAELVAPDELGAKGHFGVEVIPDPRLALRAGLKLGYDTQVFAGGFGVNTPDGRFGVDYAFAPYSDDFGNTHRFGVNLRP